MAVSSGTFSTFLSTSSFRSNASTPPSSLQLTSHPTKLRLVGVVTSATSSSKPTATNKRVRRGIMKPQPVSPEMQNLVGLPEISRSQAVRRIWAYIK